MVLGTKTVEGREKLDPEVLSVFGACPSSVTVSTRWA